MRKFEIRSVVSIAGRRRRECQSLILALAGCLLAACGPSPPVGVLGSVSGFAGAVAADEPRAATVGRDVLGANGSAADAAVAMYFTLAVTLPSSAGLGGGGVCVVHDAENRVTEALDFLPRPAAAGGVAVPANARGMAALHARYGRVRWTQLLVEAENLARFGTPTSRALARELATAGVMIVADPEAAAIFLNRDGTLLDEGDPLRQPQLAGVLAQLRQKGAGEIHTGVVARTLSEAAKSIGAPLELDDLRRTVPQWRETVQLPWGHQVLHFAPTAGGLVEAQLVAMLSEARDYAGADATERPHLFAEASKRAIVGRTRWLRPDGGSAEAASELLSSERIEAAMHGYDGERATPAASLGASLQARPENPWAASFVAVDRDGFAVACNVTMNGLFGSGRMAPGTGLLLAPVAGEPGGGAAWLGPVIMSNTPNGSLYYVAAASGGPTAATAMANVLLRALDGEESLDAAMRAKRLHHNGAPDVVYYESGEDAGVLEALARRGHRVEEAGLLGRVQAIWCPESLQGEPETCEVETDPRIDGLAIIVNE